ncbi:hypothetical protein WA026_020017 [Henosepilachna vigintioctopunctata]|uniref:Uncharacterized protein n=1 Tax=Henosepilachna vigintioctopunctata TaxID=420089 RepID=A0AAW1UW64_9CUCU
MSKKILYGIISSPPVRSVRILAKALNLDLEFKTVNVFQKDNLKEDYLKINPNHKIPSLDDNGFIVWDSHAIMMYLVDKYATNDSFYPKDLQKRTKVHQILFFDAEIFEKLRTIVILLYSGVSEIPTDKIEGVEDSYKSLNRLLQGNSYFTGNTVAICDISLLSTLLSLDVLVPINSKEYPSIKAWLTRMEDKDYIANVSGKKEITQLLTDLIKKK